MKKDSDMRLLSVLIFILLLLVFVACNSKPPLVPAKKTKKVVPPPVSGRMLSQETAVASEDLFSDKGYVYERRDRRDPFVPLIMPSEKITKRDKSKIGTLESYDIGDFTLSAIAKRGVNYFALLVTPDNRSFTVNKGVTIGLNRGKVKEISKNKIVLVEYSRDYKGDLKPRKIILEFNKGEKE